MTQPSLDLIGPAGPLEALIDAAGRPARHVRPRQSSLRIRIRSSAGRCTPRRFTRAPRVSRASGARCCASISAAWVAAPATFDQGEGEKEDFRAALDYMAARYPGTPLWAAGFSFGAWVALEVGADDRVSALIGIAPPVATSVSGQDYTFEATLASTKPKFFVQGEADEVCPIEGMWAFYGKLQEPKELVVIDARRSPVRGEGGGGRRSAGGTAAGLSRMD